MQARASPYLLLAGLALLFFGDLVLHPTQVLYAEHSDLIALHLPAKRFLVEEWQSTGELPLWCPYAFAGSPFIHDILLAAFYPPHAFLYLLPPDWIGPAMSWLVVAHLIVAGWGTFAYARSQGLGRAGALVAALGFMFAGRWLIPLLVGGHYMMLGVAWLPWVLWTLERALGRRSLCWATAAGVLLALLVLGTHPQYTFYAGLLVALMTLGPALAEAGYLDGTGSRTRKRTLAALGWWLGLGCWSVAIALGLSAVQLLPMREAAAQSSRAAALAPTREAAEGLAVAFGIVGPPVTTVPPAHLASLWEQRTGLGILWLALAFMAPFLGGPSVRFQAALGLGLFGFVLLAPLVVPWLPGFHLFRESSRVLVVAALPLALLAGAATDRLVGAMEVSAEERARCRRMLVRAVVVAFILVGGFALRSDLEGKPLAFHGYWLTCLATVPAVYWLLGARDRLTRPAALYLWIGCFLVDSWAITWPLLATRPESDLDQPSASARYLAEQRDNRGRVLDYDTATNPELCSPLGAGAPLALRQRIEALRGYTAVDVLRYREYLNFMADNARPLAAFDDTGLTHQVLPNLRVSRPALLDLLGTRYLLRPTSDHAAVEGWQAVLEDPTPSAYDFIEGGVQRLPPYTLYENRQTLPRAFVVPAAAPLPATSEEILAALRQTDFRKTVLLEDWRVDGATASGAFQPARITSYECNRVVVETVADAPGYLVLTDLWFPGWTCTIDGAPTPIYRANYLFRAVAVPAGQHEVVFTFAPDSLAWGRRISLATVALVSLLGLICGVRGWRRRAASGLS